MNEPWRVCRLDRGWSTLLAADGSTTRVRNIGADVAVGDWVQISPDGERVDAVLERNSALTRRASFEGARAESHTLAANIDYVLLLHAVNAEINPRRVERELVLAYDSGAIPVIVLTKCDLADGPPPTDSRQLLGADLEVPLHLTSAVTGEGIDELMKYAEGGKTIAVLGASGVGKSTLVNRMVGREVQRTADVRESDQRGRHTTVAAELVSLPNGGWFIDTPGVRAVSLWTDGSGIRKTFADVFALADQCRFSDCVHEDEPDCAVRDAVASGAMSSARVVAMKRLQAEQHALAEEQREREKSEDRRGFRRRRKPN